jgi:hypothetical protein
VRTKALACLFGIVVCACDTTVQDSGSNWPISCDFTSFETGSDYLVHCAKRDADGELSIRPELLAEAPTDAGIQTIHTDGNWLFALDGKAVTTLTYDNGADYFQEGLARTVQGGKIGFVNESLEVVIAPSWDFAFPFENGKAVVCNGCRPESDGEHTTIVGGGWGYIDIRGAVLVEPVHQKNSLAAPP